MIGMRGLGYGWSVIFKGNSMKKTTIHVKRKNSSKAVDEEFENLPPRAKKLIEELCAETHLSKEIIMALSRALYRAMKAQQETDDKMSKK